MFEDRANFAVLDLSWSEAVDVAMSYVTHHVPQVASLLAGAPDEQARADICLRELRNLQDRLPRDTRGLTRFLPDEVHEAYVVLFRARYGGAQHGRMNQVDADRFGSGGFVERSAFPDGRGGFRFDSYGIRGRFTVYLSGLGHRQIKNRLILRTVDAISIVLQHSAPHVLSSAAGVGIELTDDASRLVDQTIVIGSSLLAMSRSDQVAALSKLDWSTFGTSADKELLWPAPPAPAADAMVISLAPALQGRGKDYLHSKFSYRVEAYSERMADAGIATRFVSVEAERELADFVQAYRRGLQRIVIVSLYQAKRSELELLHALVAEVRSVNPAALIAIEGPVTMHGKHFLALCPESDVFIRGEADDLVVDLCRELSAGRAHTIADAQRLVRSAQGGVYLRGRDYAMVWDLDRTCTGGALTMIKPTRDTSTVWYTEHGCAYRCAFCRLDTGISQKGRVIEAETRIEWLLRRLLLELEPQPLLDIAYLRRVLAVRETALWDHPHVELRKDSRLHTHRIEIVVVSEAALGTRRVVIAFFERMVELGLQRYFHLKLADVTISSLAVQGKPDERLIGLLHAAEVFFIGFGTDNLSCEIREDLNKNFYGLDTVIAVNKALHERGFPPAGLRHNLVMSSPESHLADVKDALLLTYLAPIYNCLPSVVANGWGNSRNSKVHAIEGNFFKSRDVMLYHGHLRWQSIADDRPYAEQDDYFVSVDTPEYLVRRESSDLRYRDERIYRLCAAAAWPVMYRYHLHDLISTVYDARDFRRAHERWRQRAQGAECQALAALLDVYIGRYSDDDPAEVARTLKSHMVAGAMLSFSDYHRRLTDTPELISAFDDHGIAALVIQADEFTRRGTIDIGAAMRALAVAHERATRLMGGEHEATDSWFDEASLHTRIAYPEQQSFQYLSLVQPWRAPAEAFAELEATANALSVDLSAAVAALVTRYGDLAPGDYHRFTSTVTDYKSRGVYGNGGLFHRLVRERDPGLAVELLAAADERPDPLFVLPIVAALRAMPGLDLLPAVEIGPQLWAILVERFPSTVERERTIRLGALRLEIRS